MGRRLLVNFDFTGQFRCCGCSRLIAIDLLMLLDSQMSLYSYEINRARELVNFNKALAEIELLTGKQMY